MFLFVLHVVVPARRAYGACPGGGAGINLASTPSSMCHRPALA